MINLEDDIPFISHNNVDFLSKWYLHDQMKQLAKEKLKIGQ